ncbi:hypothetical protein EMCRGX_G027053 [Ephydatia muelleri]
MTFLGWKPVFSGPLTPSSPPLCVWTKGGTGLSCCGCIGDCMKQQGHFTSLQLKSRKQWTKQYVQTSALHDSSRGATSKRPHTLHRS